MENRLILTAGTTEAVRFAAKYLRLPTAEQPSHRVTHLLLDVPVRAMELQPVLDLLPPDITVIGGRLELPELAGYKTMDLLQDPEYLAKNAMITAHCAVKLALLSLDVTLEHCPVLILGWGRIGKSLAQLLKSVGADVTVAVRNAHDRAMLKALGYKACAFGDLSHILHGFRVIYNTVPEKTLSESTTFNTDCVKIELASHPCLPGEYIDGRGLPGKLAPRSSGRLIAETIARRI